MSGLISTFPVGFFSFFSGINESGFFGSRFRNVPAAQTVPSMNLIDLTAKRAALIFAGKSSMSRGARTDSYSLLDRVTSIVSPGAIGVAVAVSEASKGSFP